AMAHNLLKVAGIRQLLSPKIKENRKQMNGKSKFPFICFLFRAFWTAPFRDGFHPVSVFIILMKTTSSRVSFGFGLHLPHEDHFEQGFTLFWSSSPL
ncbi:hypothetical protein ACOQFO_09860, partial [Ureibacillus sp. MALMAid1270]|uniref:hypothetical protein n=1 Tax=Ureibacillus sp. MALMAid1270 TaxID=3411629 RepID=UPI003BA7014A